MRLLLLSTLLLITLTSSAQYTDKSQVELNVSGGVGLYVQEVSFNTSEDGLGATTHLSFTPMYFIEDRIAIGLDLRVNDYATDQKDSVAYVKDAGGINLGIKSRYYFVNKEKFNFYGGVGFGLCGWELYAVHPLTDGEATAGFAGNYYDIDFGFNWYFSKYVGLYFQTSLHQEHVQMTYLDHNGTEVEIFQRQELSHTLIHHLGLETKLGLSISF